MQYCLILLDFQANQNNVFLLTLPAGAVAKYCNEYVSVCLSVCLSVCEDISRTTCAIFTKFFVHVAYVCGSVLFRYVDDGLHCLTVGMG